MARPGLIALGEINSLEFVCVYTRRGGAYRPIRCDARNERKGMSTTRQRRSKQTPAPNRNDWNRLAALSDQEIDAQIGANPDAAPDVSLLPIEDAALMEPVDVKAIRSKMGMSQQQFAETFGLSVSDLRSWEQQSRAPRGPAHTLLKIIDREPEAVRRALSAAAAVLP